MKKVIIFIITGIVCLTIALTTYNSFNKNLKQQYLFADITRGDLTNTVSSTGTINAVSTVEVGTQVSGIINKIYVDFNAQVRKGQLLAVLDTVLLKTALLDAEAVEEKAQALLEQATADYHRNLPLFEKGLISEAEFLPLQIQMKTQKANVKSAQVALKRAERNLKYAFIRSPIDGMVIQRTIEEGQTVAASFQAPVLFIIAEDLSKMEIHAQVDESDIGMIKDKQRVTFSVQAYPDKIFNGTVRQIRLQPTTTQNVVNYTVVIDASNDDKLLLPGMTATIDFIIDESKDALLVPNTALRFQPSEEVIKAFFEKEKKQFAANPDSLKNKLLRRGNFSSDQNVGNFSESQRPKNFGRVWYLDKDKNLQMARLRTGATDGKVTEIVMSRQLNEGMKVIIGIQQKDVKKETTTTSRRTYGPPRPF